MNTLMHHRTLSDFDLDSSILPWLGRTQKALDLYISDEFNRHGLDLTKAQLIVLRRLAKNDGIPQNNLAFITNRDKTSLTRLIHTMEKKGLVTRQIDKTDKRINLVYISTTGANILEKAYPILGKINKEITNGLDQITIETVIKNLKQIGSNINADFLTAPLNELNK